MKSFINEKTYENVAVFMLYNLRLLAVGLGFRLAAQLGVNSVSGGLVRHNIELTVEYSLLLAKGLHHIWDLTRLP